MYRDWERGDKLVCIDDGNCNCGDARCKTNFGLVRDEIYIFDSFEDRGPLWPLAVYVGVPSNVGIHKNSKYRGMRAERFRKLNKPDALHGSKADFNTLLELHRSKQPASIPVGPIGLPFIPPKKGEIL